MSRRLIGVDRPQARSRVSWVMSLSVLVLALASGLMIGVLAFGKGVSVWQTAAYLTVIIVDQVAIYCFRQSIKTQRQTIERVNRIADLYRQEILRNREDDGQDSRLPEMRDASADEIR